MRQVSEVYLGKAAVGRRGIRKGASKESASVVIQAKRRKFVVEYILWVCVYVSCEDGLCPGSKQKRDEWRTCLDFNLVVKGCHR